MRVWRSDPGPCLICGAAHSACTPGGPIAVVQLPNRDAAQALVSDLVVATSGPLVSDLVAATLPPGSFTTSSYRGTKARR